MKREGRKFGQETLRRSLDQERIVRVNYTGTIEGTVRFGFRDDSGEFKGMDFDLAKTAIIADASAGYYVVAEDNKAYRLSVREVCGVINGINEKPPIIHISTRSGTLKSRRYGVLAA